MKQTLLKLFLIAILIVSATSIQTAYAQSATDKSPTKEQVVPESYVLSSAYPNPFNPTTSFRLTVRDKQQVKVELYNVLGQPVQQLFKGTMESGETRSFTIEAGDLPTGIYLYRVQGENFSAARQVTLLR